MIPSQNDGMPRPDQRDDADDVVARPVLRCVAASIASGTAIRIERSVAVARSARASTGSRSTISSLAGTPVEERLAEVAVHERAP